MKNQGFTLIELLAVIAIIIVIASMLIPKLLGSSYKMELMICSANLKKIGAAFSMYVVENKGYAPFNENADEISPFTGNGADFFLSWEVFYKLCPYLGDPDHEKFRNGTLDVARCPGNKFDYYVGGSALNEFDNTVPDENYSSNRQAPTVWKSYNNVPGIMQGKPCSPKRQVVDYQYNMNLGGTIAPVYRAFQSYYDRVNGANKHPRSYKLDFILRYPNEAVVFCDIHYDTVRIPNSADHFKYGYNTSLALKGVWMGGNNWPGSNNIGNLRTNEKIHDGKGINALFADGHVEFLQGTACYNTDSDRLYDDLMNWGISYPVDINNSTYKSNDLGSEIPGIHGYRRGSSSVCIEHDDKKGVTDTENTHCYWAV